MIRDDMLQRRWVRQMQAAVRLNARDPSLAILASIPTSRVAIAEAAALLVRAIPYRFDGPTHRILDLPAARRRGYAACGDAAAAIAAALFLQSIEDVTVCYEATEAVSGYAHVRIAIGGAFVDPYPEASIEAPCVERLTLTRMGVRWPAPVSSTSSSRGGAPPR